MATKKPMPGRQAKGKKPMPPGAKGGKVSKTKRAYTRKETA